MKVLFICLIFLSGCSQLRYLSNQAPEQLKLMFGGRSNGEVLRDVNVSEENKRKIILIEKYKKFFDETLGVSSEGIYEKTIFLDRKAVSYLTIRSKVNHIKSLKECFPLFGCFPYLGFFDYSEARDFTLSVGSNISTYIRPVLAYSSLGKYNDRIISTFFSFNDRRLANLVFHELFHRVFFIKDDVTSNENLASLFAAEMEKIYFRVNIDKEKKMATRRVFGQIKRRFLVGIVNSLNSDTGFKKVKSVEQSDIYIQNKIKNSLKELKNDCLEKKVELSRCKLDPKKWNSARLSEFRTYSESRGFFKSLFLKRNESLKSFLEFLNSEMRLFQEDNSKKSFVSFLKQR